MLGTNPLTFGFPTDEDFPSCWMRHLHHQRGKIEHYARIGKQMPVAG
jgi:LDH2 family malate/lactate/ureidoglycolate dehydrogenase